MKAYKNLFGIIAILLMAIGCGKDDGPDVKIEPPVFNLQKSSAVVAVDLGLSVLWSNCNMGASSPRDYGGYLRGATLRGHFGQVRALPITIKAIPGAPKTMVATYRQPTSAALNWMS